MQLLNKLLSREIYIIFALFIFAFTLRLPLLYTEYERTTDSIEYINVARNIATGNGFIKTMKINFFDEFPVIAPANYLRPLFTPSIYALVLLIKNDNYALQAFNLTLGACNIVLFYFLMSTFVNKKMAFIASLLVASNPNLIIENRFILSEQLFHCLVLSFFIVFFRLPENKKKYILLGMLAGLSYLTRIEGILLLGILCIVKRRNIAFLVITLCSFIFAASPNFIMNYITTGNPFYTFYSYHFQVMNFKEGEDYFYHQFPTPIQFITNNYPAITARIATYAKSNILNLLSFRYIGLLTLFLVLLFGKNARMSLQKTIPLIVFAVLLFLVVTGTWAVVFQPARHLALVYIISVITIFVLAKTPRQQQLLSVVVILTIFIYAAYNIHQLHWIRQSIGALDSRREKPVYTWIRNNVESQAIIATRYPLQLYLFTDRPTILIPFKLPRENVDENILDEYIKKYNIKYMYLEGNDLKEYAQKKGFLKARNGTIDSLYCVNKCKIKL